MEIPVENIGKMVIGPDGTRYVLTGFITSPAMLLRKVEDGAYGPAVVLDSEWAKEFEVTSAPLKSAPSDEEIWGSVLAWMRR